MKISVPAIALAAAVCGAVSSPSAASITYLNQSRSIAGNMWAGSTHHTASFSSSTIGAFSPSFTLTDPGYPGESATAGQSSVLGSSTITSSGWAQVLSTTQPQSLMDATSDFDVTFRVSGLIELSFTASSTNASYSFTGPGVSIARQGTSSTSVTRLLIGRGTYRITAWAVANVISPPSLWSGSWNLQFTAKPIEVQPPTRGRLIPAFHVPAPASATLVGLGALVMTRRRR